MKKIFILSRKRVILVISIVLIALFLTSALFIHGINDKPTYAPIYQGNSNAKTVALTINVDWGEEYIPMILEVLEKKNVKATFFVTGRWANKFPDILKQIYNNGHEIGNHGYSHPHPDKLSIESNKEEIIKTETIIFNILGKKTKLFASPYGEKGSNIVKAAENLGYYFILWTKDTIDWQDPNPETILKRVLKDPVNGTIILMHPRKNSLTALPKIIDGYIEAGFTFKVVSEIL